MPTSRQQERARAFRALHAARPGFIMPNAWDVGSACVLAAEAFAAIATTSGGIAFSLGKQDYQMSGVSLSVTREEMFMRMREIAAATPLPVNGDLEAGYGDRAEDVAETISLAIEAGLAGGNIEDKIPMEPALYDEKRAAERIAAARAAAGDNAFVLTARTDPFLLRQPDALANAIRRAHLYLEAGADCIFTPGVDDVETIGILAREIGAPLNIVAGLNGAHGNARAMLAAGAQRISLGGTFARAALGFIRQGARELREAGTLSFATNQLTAQDLNGLFSQARA